MSEDEAPNDKERSAGGGREAISEPAKLLRIVSMVRQLLDETRQTTVDEKGRTQLRQIYERSLQELQDVLSPDLQEELSTLAIPMEGVPSESEIRIAQAQLVGWLEGLFHGIQAAMFTQQMAARAQFEELRRRGLPAGNPDETNDAGNNPADSPAPGTPSTPGGQYL